MVVVIRNYGRTQCMHRTLDLHVKQITSESHWREAALSISLHARPGQSYLMNSRCEVSCAGEST